MIQETEDVHAELAAAVVEEPEGDQDSAETTPQVISIPPIRSFPDSRPCNVLVHEEHKAYEPVFPSNLSLESCEGDEHSANIEFAHETAIQVAGENVLGSTGDFVQTPPIPLYHAHVLWSYALRITRVKDQRISVSLVSIGSHLGLDNAMKKGAFGRNAPKNLSMPRILAATMTVLGGEDETVSFSPAAGGNLEAPTTYSAEELASMAGGEVLRVRVAITVARAYFSLSKIVDLKKSITVTDRAEGVLDVIVRGERPPGYDWAITVGESEVPGPSIFFVHKAAFGSMSDAFRAAFQTSHSWGDAILMVTGENRCIVPALAAEDMKVVIPLVYGLYAPLPDRWERVSILGRSLCKLFKPDLIQSVVFPQWERALCKASLAIDKTSGDLAGFTEILRLLTIIWSCPYGALPAAKRVAIGVLADMVHLQAHGSDKFVEDTVIPSLGPLGTTIHVPAIFAAMSNHLVTVSSVRKTGLAAAADVEWK